jgi:AcrR family transcriptional regulator
MNPLPSYLRNHPVQGRSRERLQRVLAAADELLARDGADAFTTTRVALAADVPVGSVYWYFESKDGIVDALALSYWSEFEELVAGVAEADEREPFADPAAAVLDTLAAGFRARPGFLALWYGGLRSERVRDATRQSRVAIAGSVQRILAIHWPQAPAADRAAAAAMVVLTGDGLLREAFRRNRDGDGAVLAEGKLMLDAYLAARLGGPGR